MNEDMWLDPIVEEVRRIREAHAAKFDYDLGRIFEDLKRSEKESDREIVSFAGTKAGSGSSDPRAVTRSERSADPSKTPSS